MNTARRAELLDRYVRATEIPMTVLAVALIPLLVVPVVIGLDNTAETALLTIDYTIWAIFAVDLAVRTYLATHRIDYLKRHWYDVLLVVVPFLRPLRVLRSVRSLRLLRVAAVIGLVGKIGANTRRIARHGGLQYTIALGLAAVLASAGGVYLLERDAGGAIDDPGTALWWAATTVTTVGYGDAYPVTAEGRGVAVFLMLVGLGFLSVLTANIAAFLIGPGDGETPVTTNQLMAKLEALEAELKSLRQERINIGQTDPSM